MTSLSLAELQNYLASLYRGEARITHVEELGVERAKVSEPFLELKGFGYGKSYLIEFQVRGEKRSVVLQTMRQDSFGHEYLSDRAQNLILAHKTYNRLEGHVKSLDLGAVREDGTMASLGSCGEFFILLEKVEGKEYHWDLDEVSSRGNLRPLDLDRCLALSDYLVKIHSFRKNDMPSLYTRRIRDLLGHGECIMGLIDNYPPEERFISREELHRIEKTCVDWRWKLKDRVHRLCQVHGDFHPWNVLFREGVDFTVLDRSRGEWGEAGDDVSCMTVNYIFYSLQSHGKLAGPFQKLFEAFMKNYLDKTGDEELLEVVQPFYAWRALVLASPKWYPTLSFEVRRKLINFLHNILSTDRLDWKDVNQYLET
ncbi:phosphotransferase [Candidatus Hecatella orcuttiae]|jgi:hypothetical protein|uniref:phosphotransferase n=1 Tax=Candidatus Hecatella orcuttiae TaxID=1935119 RepID=UPI002868017E|nr:phosphotransferase [Candidatus Hecatella orcuttiae]